MQESYTSSRQGQNRTVADLQNKVHEDTKSNTKARIGQVKIEQILVLSSSSKAAASEACIPRYIGFTPTEDAWNLPSLVTMHLSCALLPFLHDFPRSANKVLDGVSNSIREMVGCFLFKTRSDIFWFGKTTPQEFLRLGFGLSRAMLFKMYRTYTDMQEVLIALIVVDYPAILLVEP